MPDTFTYDLATQIGKVRFEIADNDISKITGTNRELWSCIFTDEEIAYALEQSANDPKLSASKLLMIVANTRVLLSKRQRSNGATDKDLAMAAKELREQAKALREEALEEGTVESITPVSWNDFTFRERMGYRG